MPHLSALLTLTVLLLSYVQQGASDLSLPGCASSQLPGYPCIGNETLGCFDLLWLDFVEAEQMLGPFWKYLAGHRVVFHKALVHGLIFYHNGLAPDTNLRHFLQL